MTDMTDFDSLIDKLASDAVPVRARSVRTGRLALAALSVMTSPPGKISVGTWRIALTGATRSRADSCVHVAPSTSVYGSPSSVNAASTAIEPEPWAP